jgi:3-hydroxybutyryl-CoA dehydrogenase
MLFNICVIGAGTMGNGIAQVAAQNGLSTQLFDVNNSALEKAADTIQQNLEWLVNKEKISAEAASNIFEQIHFTSNLQTCKADVFIEAIVEKAAAKTEVFNQLAAINSEESIFASNTSSLSISDLQASIIHPERVVGMHFFNPAPVMKLVEVVKGKQTAEAVAQKIYDLCLQLKKTPVLCNDAPGFIVNRIARHYYLEAMKIVESGIASIEDVDALMEASGFKMGPFKLMDLIGLDVNLAVSKSMYEAFHHTERFKPSTLQEARVAKGDLGKKTGKGFYNYKVDE